MKTNLNKNDLANKETLADKEMMTKKEVAHLFKVSTSTIDRWVKSGLLKCVKLGKNVQQGRVYFYHSDILSFQNKNYGYK